MTSTTENGWFSEDAATFGDRLAGAREAAGLAQQDLADQLGVKVTTVDAWENDLREPRANKLQMLSGLLGISLRWLLTGVGTGPEGPEGDTPIAADANAILTEMRRLRIEMAQSSVKLGQLEKRLRQILKDQ